MAPARSSASAAQTPAGSAGLEFEAHYLQCYQELRDAVIDLLAAVGGDPAKPQALARSFSLNKNLTWKVSRMVLAEDPFTAFQVVPGRAAWRIFHDALAAAGAPPAELAASREAEGRFEAMIERHGGDRGTIELILDGRSPGGDALPMELSRKLAFRGNSGIWGVQAKTRFSCFFLAPNPERPERLDSALVAGLVQLRRLRRTAPWPLQRIRQWHDDGSMIETPDEIAIDPRFDGQPGPKLMPEFCSSDDLPVRSVPIRGGALYELAEGPVGDTGAVDCVFGHATIASLGRYRDPHDAFGELHTTLDAPTENFVFDMLVHEDLAADFEPEAILVGQMSGAAAMLPERRGADQLMVKETIQRLVGSPPSVATPHVPRYRAMVARAYERMGWDAAAFTGWRLVMKHPPIPATAVLRFGLPAAPE